MALKDIFHRGVILAVISGGRQSDEQPAADHLVADGDDALVTAVDRINSAADTVEIPSFLREPKEDPPGSDLVMALIEEEVGAIVKHEFVPAAEPSTLLEKHISVTGRMIDALADRDRILTKEITDRVEERRQTRIALREYEANNRALKDGLTPVRKKKPARKPATPSKSALAAE